MKKIFGLTIFMALFLVLVACNEQVDNSDNTASFSGINDITLENGASFDPLEGVTATDSVTGNIVLTKANYSGTVNTNVAKVYTITYTVVGSDGKTTTATRKVTVTEYYNPNATEIVIMHGAPYEIDPFHADYTGTEQRERQDLQRQVERELGVRVVYRAYPAHASWGPDRVNAIINASVSNAPLADIYWTTSDWIKQLAVKEAIIPVDEYLSTHGENIAEETKNIGKYNGKLYGFAPGKPTVDTGLYYNKNLLKQLGIQNPTELYLNGEWNWSAFEAWAESAKTALASIGETYNALGGILGVYAQNMVPLNGGALIDSRTFTVDFANTPAVETYDFLSDLWEKGLFEANGAYDAGSAAWQSGHVLMHPGNLWFVNAPERWGKLPFELGFVPYPSSDTYKGRYSSRVSGFAMFNVASGLSKEKEELAFQVWNALQLWKDDEDFAYDFELSLNSKFTDRESVEAYLAIYDKTQPDLLNSLGISQYSPNGFMSKINTAIKTRNSRAAMLEIKPIYETALEEYLSGI